MNKLKQKISKLFFDSLMACEGYDTPKNFNNEINLGEKILIIIPHYYPFDWEIDYDKNYLDIFTHYYDGNNIIYIFIAKKKGITTAMLRSYITYSKKEIIEVPYLININMNHV